MPFSRFPIGAVITFLAAGGVLGMLGLASAQESRQAPPDNSLQVLLSVQELLTRSIERCERSVVSIARIKKRGRDTVAAPYDRVRALNASGPRTPTDPKDPDFIPNDFATGVVVDAIRCCKLGLDRGLSGSLVGPSSYFMKSPPIQYTDSEAHDLVEAFIEGKEQQ